MKTNLKSSGPFIGMAGMAVAAFLYGYSAIVLRGWLFQLVLPAVWFVFFFLSCRWFMTRPYSMLALPLIAIAVWFAAMLTR